MVETRSKKRKKQRLMQSYVPRRSDLPAIFESLNDDTLTKTLEFVGDKSYRSFGGLNYHCREIYLSSGLTKETFLYGYAPLSVIQVRIERATTSDRELFERVGKGVVLYNRKDIFEWALKEQKKSVLSGICVVAAGEERTNLLDEVWENVEDWDEDDKHDVFGYVLSCAAESGKLEVFKWFCTKKPSFKKDMCAREAARHGHLHILQWLREEEGFQLEGPLYVNAALGGHFHVVKWLREQEVDWSHLTFRIAVRKGTLDILQWLHDEGCPWPEYQLICESELMPEVVDWLRANSYGDRIIV